MITTDDIPDLPPVTCCLSEERGPDKKRQIQIAMNFDDRIQIGRPPLPAFYVNISLDEAMKLQKELAEAIDTIDPQTVPFR